MKQITVFVPDECGIAATITSLLAERGVNIEDLDIDAIADHGLIVLTVDLYDEALRVLRDHGFKAITQDALLIKLEDKPGALAVIAVRLKDAGLDLRSMHIHRRENGYAFASLVASDNQKAASILRDVLAVEPPRYQP